MIDKLTKEVMDELVRCGSMSADSVAIGFVGTEAEKVRAAIERALEALIANGRIQVTPWDGWTMFYVIDPPYEQVFGKEQK